MTVTRRMVMAGATITAAVGLLIVPGPSLASAATGARAASAAAVWAPAIVPGATAVTRTVTATDSQTTITLRVGDTLAVALGSDFDPPTVTGAVLTPLSISGGYPTGLPLAATYRVAARGTADVRTQTDYPCLHSVPRCARPVMVWVVHVNAVPAT